MGIGQGSRITKYTNLLLVLACLLFVQQGTGKRYIPEVRLADQVDRDIFKSGDIIFRQGISLVSRLVHMFDQEVTYTHVGIIVKEEGKVMVVHAVPAEGSDTIDIVKKESLEVFLQPERARALAVMRPKAKDDERGQAAEWALRKAEEKTPFDNAFNLNETNTLYCTELIWQAYLQCGLDLCNGEFDHLPVSLGHENYILPARILTSEHLESILYLPTKSKKS